MRRSGRSMAAAGRFSSAILCLSLAAFVSLDCADRPLSEVKVEPSSLIAQYQSSPDELAVEDTSETTKKPPAELRDDTEDISNQMQTNEQVANQRDSLEDDLDVGQRKDEGAQDLLTQERERLPEELRDEENQEGNEGLNKDGGTDEEESHSSNAGKGGDVKFFKGTHALGMDLEKLVQKLSTHVNKDMNNEGEAALHSSKEYQGRLKNLDHGLTQFTVGVDHFRKGTAKSHHTKTALIRDTMSKGLKSGEAPSEQPHDDVD